MNRPRFKGVTPFRADVASILRIVIMTQEFLMLRRKKILILIPAILLIPMLLGMTPFNKAHKLANGGPFTHGKQECSNNQCPFQCLISHDDPPVGILNSTPLDQELLHSQGVRIAFAASSHPNIYFNSIPLRC